QVQIFLNDGHGSFSAAPIETLTTHSIPDVISVADVDKDSWPDLIVGTQAGHDVSVYLNTRNVAQPFSQTPTWNAAMPTADGVPLALAIGDFNGDTFPDIAVGIARYLQTQTDLSEISGDVAIFTNVVTSSKSFGKFSLAKTVASVGTDPHSL